MITFPTEFDSTVEISVANFFPKSASLSSDVSGAPAIYSGNNLPNNVTKLMLSLVLSAVY